MRESDIRKRTSRRGRKKKSDTRFRCLADAPKRLQSTNAKKLVERGWVLLHNPSQGIAFPTKNPVKEYTKAQKEFLYDYYMERDCKKEANAIWQEDE